MDRTIALWEPLLPERKQETALPVCSEDREKICKLIDACDDPPREFMCPITLCAMRTPTVAEDGQSYEKHAIITHFRQKPYTSPLTNAPLACETLFPNFALASLMESWVRAGHLGC